jgi:anti-anti-sigma factor
MIRALDQPNVLMLDVAGSATVTETPAVSELASERINEGRIRGVRIDLRDCTMMDSTFSGTLLALKRQLEASGGTLTLVSPSSKVLEMLSQMGLDDFYDVEISERPDGDWKDVAKAPLQLERLQRLILDAHDELVRVPEAEHTFRDVVDELRRDEKNVTRSAASPSSLTSSSAGAKLEACSSASPFPRSHPSPSS